MPVDPAVINYLRFKGFLGAPSMAPANPIDTSTEAPPANALTEAPPLPAPLPAPVPSAPPAPTPVPGPVNPAAKTGALDWKGALAVSLGGLGDALKAGAGDRSGGGAAGALKTIQEGPEKAMEAQQRGRTLANQKEQDDPESAVSKAQAALLVKMGTDPKKLEGLSYTEMQPMAAISEKAYGVDANTKERLMAANIAAQARTDSARMHEETMRGMREISMGQKENQFDTNKWIQLGDKVNTLNASSRKALGIAATNNLRADRLLKTVQQDKITSQDVSNLIADVQGIYKGGVPDEVSLKHGDYPTFQRKISEVLSMLTSNPQNANSPGVVKHLKDIALELKDVDNKVVKDNLGINAVVFKDTISKDPERWNDLVNAITKTTENPPPPPAQAPPAGTPPTITNKADYDKLPAGAEYLDAKGTHRRKK